MLGIKSGTRLWSNAGIKRIPIDSSAALPVSPTKTPDLGPSGWREAKKGGMAKIAHKASGIQCGI